MEFRPLLLLLFGMLVLASCEGGGSTPPDPVPISPNTESSIEDQAKIESPQALSAYKVWRDLPAKDTTLEESKYLEVMAEIGPITFECPQGGCHPSVGLVYSNEGRCEGTLISEDEILTANHCVQDNLFRMQNQNHLFLNNIPKACERIAVYLPETQDHTEEIVGCKSLRGADNWDFAIIKLQRKITRPILGLSDDMSSLKKTAVVINRTSPGHYKEELLPCKAAGSFHPQNAVVRQRAFYDCQIKRGNSGGPILNEDGSIWGIVSLTERLWGVEIAGSAKCINSFLIDPKQSMKECWNEAGDMTAYFEKHGNGLPPRTEDQAYFADPWLFRALGVIPKCLPDPKGQRYVYFEGSLCSLLGPKISKPDSLINLNLKDCMPSENKFIVGLEFEDRFYVQLHMSNQHTRITNSFYIPKCTENL